MRSFLLGTLLLDVEVFDLIGRLVDSDYVQKLTKTVSFEILLGEVLQVSLGKSNIGLNSYLLVVTVYLHLLSQLAGFAVNFYPVFQELCEVGGVEDLILDGLGAVNHESSGDFGLSFLGNSFFGFDGLSIDSHWCLFCGHHNIYFYIII